MICFGKTTTFVSTDTLHLSCEFLITYEHSDDEPIAFGTPAYWDAAIWKYYNSGYRVFGVYEKKLSREKCNRITNHKQIWGLQGMPKGRAEAMLDFGNDRLYLGIAEENVDSLPECDAPICLLIPTESIDHLDNMWHLFISELSALSYVDWLAGLKRVVRAFPEIIALFYQCSEKAVLTVVCDRPEVMQDYFKTVPVPENKLPHFRRFIN